MAKKLLCHLHVLIAVNETSAASSADRPPGRDFQVLIFEPDEQVAMEIVSALGEAAPEMRARVARSLGEAQRLVVDQKPALFVLDVDATYDMGQEFIYDLRTSHPNARAIILTAIHFAAQREKISGLGAIHFLEKPFPRADFIALVEALLIPDGEAEGTHFQGTLSDLHVADIIQLKCISGATSMLEFTGPHGEKARVYFENGQVRHATAPGKEGMAAFNEIVDWAGGKISEVPVPYGTPHTIHLDWQVLLMEAVREIDESRAAAAVSPLASAPSSDGRRRHVLVIDDSAMLLSFVKEILGERGCEVTTAETGEEGLRLCASNLPDLILLDFVLPDMKGDEVCRRLLADPEEAKIPVIYVSGFGADLRTEAGELPNVVGALHKPFTSEALLRTVQKYLGWAELPDAPEPMPAPREIAPPEPVRRPLPGNSPAPMESVGASNGPQPQESLAAAAETPAPAPSATTPEPSVAAYFCGDSSFFSLHWALQTIARENLTGILRAFWDRDAIELLARQGRVVVVTSRSPSLYCEETPVTLLNVPQEAVAGASARQAENGCPIFLTLANEGSILREPALQLVQHYGQKTFSKLWTTRVRFVFEQHELPEYAGDLPAAEEEIDQWALSTLRFVQYQELGKNVLMDDSSVPAYTRDGYERVQGLRLTAAEAQFASQFDGSRSIAQIAKNLRLDIKFARLTLFRFLALEIVECWPAQLSSERQTRGGLRGFFGR